MRANPSFYRTFGSTDETSPEAARYFLRQPPVQKLFQKILAEGSVSRHETEAECPDGRKRVFLIDGHVARARGVPIHVHLFLHEVSGLRACEAEAAQTRRRLRVATAVTRIIAEGKGLHEAGTGLLEAMCRALEWTTGSLWQLAPGKAHLELAAFWSDPSARTPRFEQATRASAFERGSGLPGAVWAGGKPVWIRDVAKAANFPRAQSAAEENLHAAFGFPIQCAGEFLGVIEFFHRRILPPDDDLLDLAQGIGTQAGQLIGRLRNEETLAMNERWLNAIFTSAQDAMLLVADDARFREANPAALRMLGFTREELLGLTIDQISPPASRPQFKSAWKAFLAAGSSAGEYQVLCRNGAILDAEFQAVANIIPGLHLSILRDVTERKKSEERAHFLADAGELLGEIQDPGSILSRLARMSVPRFADACLIDLLQPSGQVERVEVAHSDPRVAKKAREFREQFPIDPRRSVGVPNVLRTGQSELLSPLSLAHVRQSSGSEEECRAALAFGIKSAMVVPLKARGKPFGALTFLHAESGRSFGPADLATAEEVGRRMGLAVENGWLFLASRNELTQRKKAELALKNLNHDLERRVRERTEELQEINAQMESFCYSISHDLRAPLRSMQGFSQALLEDCSEALGPEGLDFARRILHGAEHMDRLLQDILAYSRLTRGQIQFEALDPASILLDVQAQLGPELKKKKTRLLIEKNLPPVLGHRATFELMLANLISNAVKFARRGVDPVVRVSAEPVGGSVRLWVEDNGIGIAPEHQERIFRMFERLHGVEEYPGSGVGLALVRKGAERMNGRVGLESEVGKGSRFWVELPAPPARNGPAPIPAAPAI